MNPRQKKKKGDSVSKKEKKAGSEPHRMCPFHNLKSSRAEGPAISMRWERRESRYQRRPAGCSLEKRVSWAVLWILKWKVLGTRSCPTLCSSMDYSPPGSSVYEILQAIILEWVAMPFTRGSSQPRDWTWVSHIAGRFFTIWANMKDNANIRFMEII